MSQRRWFPSRRLGSAASVGLFMILFVALNWLVMWLDVGRQFPGADQAIYRSRSLGLGTAYLLAMSLPSAAGFGVALAVTNRWCRRRNRPAITALWIPLTSAVLAAGLTYTGVPKVLLAATETMLGPDSMWMLMTWPFGQAVFAAGVCIVVALIGRRGRLLPHAVLDAG